MKSFKKAKSFYLYLTVLHSSEYKCDIFIRFFSPYNLIKLLITTLLRQSLSHSNCNFTLLEKVWSKKLFSSLKEMGSLLTEENKEKLNSDLNADTVFIKIGRLSRAWFFIHLNLVRAFSVSGIEKQTFSSSGVWFLYL